jgi:LPXTG-motif cell wall-anchored protein
MAEAEAKKSFLNMLGEFCRESAVLIFVFGNLDFWAHLDQRSHIPTTGEATNYTLKIFGLTIAFGLLGYIFEK